MSTLLPEPNTNGSDPMALQPENLGDPNAAKDTEKPLATAEELIAKAIAPVKQQFLCHNPIKSSIQQPSNDVVLDTKPSSNASVVKEKKSKRQAKRERKQEQKSVLHLCPVIAKSGNLSSCQYGDKCRFSHDVDGFKSEKPVDLEGNCPFLKEEGPCPYGLACRFFGTHKADTGTISTQTRESETNGLRKDVQKLLWKNKMKFPKADAQLKILGLLQKQANSKKKDLADDEEEDLTVSTASHVNEGNGCAEVDMSIRSDCCTEVVEEDVKIYDTSMPDELRPLKKAKASINESQSCEVNNGSSVQEKDLEECVKPTSTDSHIATETDKSLKTHAREKKLIDFSDKLYLAPLTTVGNLPFRRVCKVLGADVTCGEMAMCTNLLQGQASEWALLRRHSSEDIFGVQICGAYPDTVSRAVELIDQECTVDFIDINMGCPIDLVVNKGAGSALLTKPVRIKNVLQVASGTVDKPITVKVRTGYFEGRNRVEGLINDISNWGASAITIHGRSRQQRYSKLPDWEYVYGCARKAPDALQVIGNGDVYSYLDWNKHKTACPNLSTLMIARGALMKPWIFTEIKEQRHWDISSAERLNILKDYVHVGLEHWGSDSKGVETTRHFLLEWLSYTYRYIPVGVLDVVPAQLNWRSPSYFGRDDLETLMASDSAADWIKISEMLLGKVPAGFTFSPKHKSNSHDRAENG
ncbi:tRNA-dihydrouridine(47) synthase [NAD(P)(+)]-like isoform X1 [Apium graveolens]|uniref:tRNA-dihydrouridine(47) synthase [NAD(P)(+)]-like isoform X1 n=1 Tax=Apium graveolens TaxID=4045 RepID=UPI003D7AC7DD